MYFLCFQTDLRTISVSHWGSDLGLKVLSGLSKLYTSLVWESTVLLALCSEDILPPGCAFGKADMDKLLPKDFKVEKEDMSPGSTKEMGSNGVSAAMESLSTSENNETPMEVNDGASTSKEDKDGKKSKMSPALQAQVKQLKPLLSVSSRLCRTLALSLSLSLSHLLLQCHMHTFKKRNSNSYDHSGRFNGCKREPLLEMCFEIVVVILHISSVFHAPL